MLMASPPPPSRRPPAASGSVTSLGDDQLAPAPAAVPRQPRTKRGHRSRSPVQQRRRYSASSTVSSGTLGSDASTTCAEDREVGTITTTSSAGASASSSSSSAAAAAAAAASPATEMRASSGVRSVVSRLLDKAAKLRSMPARPEVKVTPAHDQFEVQKPPSFHPPRHLATHTLNQTNQPHLYSNLWQRLRLCAKQGHEAVCPWWALPPSLIPLPFTLVSRRTSMVPCTW